MKPQDPMRRLAAGEWRWYFGANASQAFAFECSSCGSCCRGDMTIVLNLADLQRIARFMGFDAIARLWEQGLVEAIAREDGGAGFRPAMRFKRHPVRFCPFLENDLDDSFRLHGRCRLHPDLKPLVCKLAPAGREVLFDDSMQASEQWVFTEPVSGCPGCRVAHMHEAVTWIRPYQVELTLELRYFRIMEQMGRDGASLDRFREFHWQLAVMEPIEAYLYQWEQRLQIVADGSG